MVQFRLVLYFVPEKDAEIQRMVCLLPLLSAGKRAHTDSDIETRKKGAKCALCVFWCRWPDSNRHVLADNRF